MQAAWPERLSPKSQDAVALQQIKERGALPYDWSWWYPSGNRPLQQYLGFTAGRCGYEAGLSIRLDSLIAKFKEGGTVRRDWCMSRVTAIISALVICIIVCLVMGLTHYRDNAITLATKPSATKMPENWSWRTRQLLTWCVKVMLRSMQNTRSDIDAKAENDALRDDVAAGRRRLHIKAVCQSVREATTPPAWIMQPPPTGRHRWTGLFHPQERGWSLCKNNWKEPRSILMSSADRAAHIDGQPCNYCEQYTRASSGV